MLCVILCASVILLGSLLSVVALINLVGSVVTSGSGVKLVWITVWVGVLLRF